MKNVKRMKIKSRKKNEMQNFVTLETGEGKMYEIKLTKFKCVKEN